MDAQVAEQASKRSLSPNWKLLVLCVGAYILIAVIAGIVWLCQVWWSARSKSSSPFRKVVTLPSGTQVSLRQPKLA